VGGNPNLRPERSRQYSYGAAWAPAPQLALTLSRFRVDIRDLIATLTDQSVFTQYDIYGATNVRRAPSDPAHPGLPGQILAVLLPTTNYGRQEVLGTDVDMRNDFVLGDTGQLRITFGGTYLDHYRQTTTTGDFAEFAGRRGAIGAIPRWRHNAAATWSRGAWSATLAQTYQLGYYEPDPILGGVRRVGSYSLWDLQAQYGGLRDVVLAAGVRNLFDRDPPVSNQNQAFQVGYDPTYADPRGRMFYASVRYVFR
jgi:iron complex outermembrane receptor protein